MIIYKVTNKINNKVYIGQTINTLDYRMGQHLKDCKRDNYYFHNAINKYKIGNFKWEIICWCDNLNQLNLMEELFINVYDSTNREKGYNLKKGGLNGGKCCEETKMKIGDTTIEKWKNPEIANRMRDGLRKATEKWINICKSNLIDRECSICGTIFKIQPKNPKKFCCRECYLKSLKNRTNFMIGIKKAMEINSKNYNDHKAEVIKLVEIWIKKNSELLKNVKFNKLSFLNDLCDFLNIKDLRTVAKFLDVSGRKELVKKLIEISKNICCAGPN